MLPCPNNYAILVPEHRTFPFFNDFTLLMNLQKKTSLEIVSLATVLIAVIGFIDYLFNLNFTSRLPSLVSTCSIKFFRKFNIILSFTFFYGE
jgi:hypothetical protein